MYTVRAALVVVAAGLLANSGAQWTIDPDSVDLTTRESWCSSQTSQCPLICTQVAGTNESSTTQANTCDPKTLEYSCLCVNGQTPDLSQYSLTMPYFECTEYGNQCVEACNGNNACASACRSNHPCGAQSPVKGNTTMTSSSATATSTATSTSSGQVYTGFASSGATTTASSSGKSGAQAAFDVGRTYSLAIVLAGMVAGFGLML